MEFMVYFISQFSVIASLGYGLDRSSTWQLHLYGFDWLVKQGNWQGALL